MKESRNCNEKQKNGKKKFKRKDEIEDILIYPEMNVHHYFGVVPIEVKINKYINR